MAKLPAMQNQYVEFAKNDGEGNELSKINTASSIPVLTEDNVAKIFEKKPRVIEYNGNIYYLSIADANLYYFTTLLDDYTCNYIILNASEIYEEQTLIVASQDSAGTKLYKHFITSVGYPAGNAYCVLINNTVMPLIWDVKVLIEQYPSSCQTKRTLC